MDAIKTNQLRKEFGSNVAVSDLTLQVQKGEVFGFLGPNGAGKTTSVKILLGLASPTSGDGQLLGKPIGDRAARSQVGYLPEHFRFHDWLTATEFLRLHGKLYGMSNAAIDAAIPDLLQLVGLGSQANEKVGSYSKGMTQRIGLAQALINNPQLIFLDEPTSGLDPIGRKLVRDIIQGLRDEGVTIFLNSHLLSEVEMTCDRVAFIRKGELVETTTMAEWSQQKVQLTMRVGQITADLLSGLGQFGELNPSQLNGKIILGISDEAHIPALVNWLTENNHQLYELTPSRPTLEERFIQIMGEDATYS